MAEEEKMSTIVMKVNIDCHGCREKMRRALLNIEGMNGFHIDSTRNKVTVNIKGNVDSDKIIRRLSRKTGRHVQRLKEEENPAKEEPLHHFHHNYANNFPFFGQEDELCTIM